MQTVRRGREGEAMKVEDTSGNETQRETNKVLKRHVHHYYLTMALMMTGGGEHQAKEFLCVVLLTLTAMRALTRRWGVGCDGDVHTSIRKEAINVYNF